MTDIQTDTESTEESEHVANLRERAEKVPELEQSAAIRDLEMGLLRGPGIDLATKQGRAWAAQYDGDWTDSDSMKTDFNSLFGNTQSGDADTDEEFDSGMTEDMRANQTGVVTQPGDAAGEVQSPIQQAHGTQKQFLANGAPPDAARVAGVGKLLELGEQGAEGMHWTPEARKAWKDLFPW